MTFADQLLPWVGILRRLFFHVKNKLYSKPKEHSPAEASHLLKYIHPFSQLISLSGARGGITIPQSLQIC